MDTAILIGLVLSSLAFATPLLLAALGELVGERAGVLNIGLEGMMLLGAWAGAAASFAAGNAFAGVLAAMGAGMALAAVFAWLSISRRADAIVVGTGINLLALGLSGVGERALTARAGDYTPLIFSPWLFTIGGGVLAVLLLTLFFRTQAGLKLRACGEHPGAAEAAGVSAVRVRWQATLANGALCGLAGAFLVAHSGSFGENMTAGRGFIALAIVILGRWNPLGAVVAALLFGAAEGMQFWTQLQVGAQYYALVLTLPYVLTLLTLAGYSGRVAAPAALGLPLED
jgi:simple sugar transport system permease protein